MEDAAEFVFHTDSDGVKSVSLPVLPGDVVRHHVAVKLLKIVDKRLSAAELLSVAQSGEYVAVREIIDHDLSKLPSLPV